MRSISALSQSPAPLHLPGGKSARRALTSEDLLWLKLWYRVGDVLSQERRERLFDAIRREPTVRKVKADDLLIIDVAEARKQIAARVRDLSEAEAMVERRRSVMGNEPVFRGTRIPVRLIASMLAEGTREDEILEGYPGLDRHKLALAKLWMTAHPRRGRPKTLKDRGLRPKATRRTSLKGDPGPSGTGACRRGFLSTSAFTPRLSRWRWPVDMRRNM
jgi:uncharacterized protein (DUF433 family)